MLTSTANTPFFQSYPTPTTANRLHARKALKDFSTEDLRRYAAGLNESIEQAMIQSDPSPRIKFTEMMRDVALEIVNEREKDLTLID